MVFPRTDPDIISVPERLRRENGVPDRTGEERIRAWPARRTESLGAPDSLLFFKAIRVTLGANPGMG